MTLQLRAARPLDAGRLGDILWEFCDGTDWYPNTLCWAEAIGLCGAMIDQGWVTVAQDQNGPLGFVASDGAHIHAIFVAQQARGAGVGQTLISAAQQQATQLSLWTFEANTPAQALFRSCGFKQVGQSDGHSTDEGLPAVTYLWDRKITT